MLRAILAIIAAFALWTTLWLIGNALFFSDAAEVVGRGEPYTDPGPLAGVLALSLVCSLVAGLTAALIGGKRARAAAIVAGVLLLLTGIGVQAGVWDRMPLWYHLSFLILLVPVTLLGSRLALVRRAPSSAPA